MKTKPVVILIGLIFALVPALIVGIGAGFFFMDWRVGLIVGLALFGASCDVLFNRNESKDGCL